MAPHVRRSTRRRPAAVDNEADSRPLRRPLSPGRLEGDVRGVFERQWARATRDQLLGAGLTEQQLRYRRETGRLVQVHPRVYSPGYDLEWSREMGAVLAYGGEAHVSHQPAASLWGLWPHWRADVHVTVPGRAVRRHPGLKPHRAALPAEDRAKRHGIPVTSPARTIHDIASLVAPKDLARAFEEARRRRLVGVEELKKRKRLPAALRTLLEAATHDRGFTRSGMERRLRELCRQAQLPEPAANYRTAAGEIDLAWPECGLAVEFDSWEFHRTPEAQDRDANKTTRLQAAGWFVIRVSELRLRRFPLAVVADVAAALARPARAPAR